MSPEVKLWRAVIWKTILDLKGVLLSAKNQQNKVGKVPIRLKHDIDQIHNEIKTDWFKEVCDMAEVHHDWVYKLVERMKNKVGYNNFRFQEGICSRKR